MIGDVNIFLKGDPSDEDFEAEVGVMIAGMQSRISGSCTYSTAFNLREKLSGQGSRARGAETDVIIRSRVPCVSYELTIVANA